jgi:drug/metabolite transporter (DMT)-like permease
VTEKETRTKAYLLLGILALIWGTSFILIKQGLKVFSADEVGALRVSAACLFLVPMALKHLKELQRPDYWKLFASGMMAIFFPAFLFATAQTHMDSAVAGILNTLTPLFTMIIGAMVFRQRFAWNAITGILLGLVGALTLSLSRNGNVTGINVYALFIVLGCLSYGCNLNFTKFKLPHLKSTTITSVALLLIGPLALIYLLQFTDFSMKLTHAAGGWKAAGFVVLLGLMSTSVATLLFNELVKLRGPMFTSSVTYLLPIVGLFWGFVDGEDLGTGHFIGLAAILVGVYLANKRPIVKAAASPRTA